jgi:sarcosine oxidase, subunit gamma
MSALEFEVRAPRDRCGLKGPRAAQWLVAQGIALPEAPNTWTNSASSSADEGERDDALLVAQLGVGEFFLEDRAGGTSLRRIAPAAESTFPGVYPVLREDAAFLLAGEGCHDVLAQVCNVNFADLRMDSQPIIMTLMIGVAVLVVPEGAGAESRYRIWCDPTFGFYLGDALEAVVMECGGTVRGVMA